MSWVLLLLDEDSVPCDKSESYSWYDKSGVSPFSSFIFPFGGMMIFCDVTSLCGVDASKNNVFGTNSDPKTVFSPLTALG